MVLGRTRCGYVHTGLVPKGFFKWNPKPRAQCPRRNPEAVEFLAFIPTGFQYPKS